MNVLAIGNSFSEDATRYLHGIARAGGDKLDVVNLYIGGCPLERHYRNMLSEARAYELQYNGQKTGFSVSLKEALLNRSWDVITLQQASIHSFVYDSYEPYLEELVKYIKTCAPKAKIYLHETWAYENESWKLLTLAKYDTFENMQRDVTLTYQKAKEKISADGIIPSGEVFDKLLKMGVQKIHRDTFHASLGLGRYALGLIWYQTLFGKSITDNSFSDFDEEITKEEIDLAKEAVSSFLS